MIVTPKHIRTSSELLFKKIAVYIPDIFHIDFDYQEKIIIKIYQNQQILIYYQ